MNYFNKFNKLKVKYKDKVIPILPVFLAALGLFMVTIGGSYAYLTHVEEAELVNKITAGTLELTFSTKDNNINLINAVPQEDSVALSENDEYTFNIKNSGDITTYYEMRLKDVCEVGSSVNDDVIDSCIPLEFVRIAFKKGEEEYVIKHMNEEGSVLLDVDTLNAGADSDSFSLKIWLDINTPNIYNDASKNIVFSAKLSLYAEQRYVQKVGAECLTIEDNKIVDYMCDYTDIEIDNDLINNTSQVSNSKVYRPKRLDSINNYGEVEHVDNVIVDTIASEAFKSKGLKSVIINSNITTIEDNAFLDNPSLKDVVVGSVNLSEQSFTTGGRIISMKDLNGKFPMSCFIVSSGSLSKYNCKGAVNVVVPDNVISIGSAVFKNLSVETVDFSRAIDLSTVGVDAFNDNSLIMVDFSKNLNLKYIHSRSFVNNNIVSLKLPVGVLNSIDVSAFSGNKITNLVIPDSVTNLGIYAFLNNKISELHLGNNIKTIGTGTFSTNELKEVIFPDSVISIGDYAFNKNNLEKITLGTSVQTISSQAFRNNKLKSVYLPDSLTSLGAYAFENNLLEDVRFSTNLATIGEYAFSKNKLEKINLPSSLLVIGKYAFSNNVLKKLVIPDSVTTIDNYAFHTNLIEDVELGVSVVSIGDYSFSANKLNIDLVIPASVEKIGEGAFAKYSGSNESLNKVINKTGLAFSWVNVFSAGEADELLVEGVIPNNIGNVEVVAG